MGMETRSTNRTVQEVSDPPAPVENLMPGVGQSRRSSGDHPNNDNGPSSGPSRPPKRKTTTTSSKRRHAPPAAPREDEQDAQPISRTLPDVRNPDDRTPERSQDVPAPLGQKTNTIIRHTPCRPPPMTAEERGEDNQPSTSASSISDSRPSSPSNELMCNSCGRSYQSKSGLAKHRLTCGTRNRRQCQFCERIFATFAGVRAHETKTHKELNQEQRRTRFERSEVEILQLMANIEASAKKGAHIRKILAEATGLTVHQVRHWRTKPAYQDLLDAQKQHLSRPATGQIAPPPPPPDDPSDDSDDQPDDEDMQGPLVPSSPPPPPDRTPQPSPKRPADTGGPIHTPVPELLLNHLRAIEADLLSRDNPDQHVLSLVRAGCSNMDKAALTTFLNEWLAKSDEKYQWCRKAHRGPNRRQGHNNYAQRCTGSNERAANYKRVQDLYKKNRTSLIEKIITDTPLAVPDDHPTSEDVETLYRGIMGSESPQDEQPIANPKNCEEMFIPIKAAEIKEAKTTWANSAPGLDGVQISGLKKTPDHTLSALFSIILMRNIHPQRFKEARTTLIFKSGNRRDPGNWRPITISSAIQRLLHRVIARRLRSGLELHFNQRGFLEGDGTLANALILDNFIRTRRLDTKSFAVVSLDVKKAFDSVSHHSIRRGLKRMGISDDFSRYITDSLANTHTTIQVGRANTNRIHLTRGVKQGDPMSPLLFNAVIDELLCELNDGRRGALIGEGTRVSAMAFADDIIILADDPKEVPSVIRQAATFLCSRGMEVNASKSASMCVERRRGELVEWNTSIFSINGNPIPATTGMNSFKYLGHHFNTSGSLKPSLSLLPTWLRRIQKAPLKPDQKLSSIKDFIIPRLMYSLQNPKITGQQLRSADRLIRQCIKTALHLNIHTPNAAIHARIADGGLGILELRRLIPQVFLKRLDRMELRTNDIAVLATSRNPLTTRLRERLAALSGDATDQQYWRNRIEQCPFTKGMQLARDDQASRSWLQSTPAGWTGRDFVKAIQLRSNNLPTKGIPSNPPDQQRCRAGCNKVESLSHVLQQCPATHWERIQRHNEIAKKIASDVRKRWPVEEERHIRHPDGTLYKPDLVIHQPGTTLIVDIGVNWEGSIPMERIYAQKQLVYDHLKFREAAAARQIGEDITVLPIIIGARGIWPIVNRQVTEILKIPSKVRASCVHSALKWGGTIHGAFGRKVWDKQH